MPVEKGKQCTLGSVVRGDLKRLPCDLMEYQAPLDGTKKFRHKEATSLQLRLPRPHWLSNATDSQSPSKFWLPSEVYSTRPPVVFVSPGRRGAQTSWESFPMQLSAAFSILLATLGHMAPVVYIHLHITDQKVSPPTRPTHTPS